MFDESSLANQASASSRGKACVACRRRKLKCDSNRPFCTQCKKSKIEDDCEYQDGIHKSHTRQLLEQIAELEQRLEQLQEQQAAEKAAHAADKAGPSSPSLSFTSSSTESFTHPQTPRRFDSASSEIPFEFGDFLYSLPVTPYEEGIGAISFDGKPWELNTSLYFDAEGPLSAVSFDSQVIPQETMDELVNVFLPHRHQVGLKVPSARLLQFTQYPSYTNNVLLHTMCLLGCHFSTSPQHRMLEERLLYRSRRLLNNSIESADRLLDTIRASCLLAMYFLIKGHTMEGRYHASAAVSLALRCRLHQLGKPQFDSPFDSLTSPVTPTSPSTFADLLSSQDKSMSYTEDDIQAFWQVYYLDKCFSILLGMPSAFPTGNRSRQLRIETPWPRDPEPFANISDALFFTGLGSFDNLSTMYDGKESACDSMSQSSLCMRAITLFEAAKSVSEMCVMDGPKSEFTPYPWQACTSLQRTVHHVSRHIPSIATISLTLQTNPDRGLELLVACAVLLATKIILRMFPDTRENILGCLNDMLIIIQLIDDHHYELVDPVFKVCLQTSLDLSLRHHPGLLNPTDSSNFALNQSFPQTDIIAQALKKFENVFPALP